MKYLLLVSLLLYAAGFISLLLHHRSKNKGAFAVPSVAFISCGLVLHTVVLVERTFSTGRLPVAAVGETLLFYGWSVAALSTVVMLRYRERFTALVTVPFAVLALFFSIVRMTPPRPLPLILRTYWFEVHVITSFAAYALFTLAFAGALFYIVGGLKKVRSLEERCTDFLDVVSKGVLWGFFFFSASMFAGAVWGWLAWGAYWLWEPKILWSFIVWFWYAGAMHVWYVKEWKGRGLAAAALLGFFIVIFTYLGVGLLMKSSHSF